MYKIGDKVIHQQEGACHIKGLVYMEMDYITKQYYILEPVFDKKAKVYISIENHKNKERIRPAVSLTQMKESEIIADSIAPDWIVDPKRRHHAYLDIIYHFEFLDVFLVLKYLTVQNKKKALCATDKELLLTAQKLIYSEISIVLNLGYEVVAEKVKKFLLLNRNIEIAL